MASAAQIEQESLADIAKREADEVEEEIALNTDPVDDEPEEPAEPEYVPPTPTAAARKAALEVRKAVREADILGPDRAVSALIQMIDIIPDFTPTEEWPGDEDEEYCESKVVERMADVLIKGCSKLTIKPSELVCLWRNKEKWEAGGKTVRGNVKSFPTRVRHLLNGKRACIEINYHHFKTLNPLQRVFAVYHELRQLDARGSVVKAEFSGFYDELEIFGARVFREMMELARVMELGAQVTHQHQLPLFDDEE